VGDGLRLALTTFTVAPVRGPAAVDRRAAGTAMALAPVVGLLLGAAAAGVEKAVQGAGAPLLAVVLAVAVLAVLTRGLHLDGLADTADGLASYRPREQALAVMRSPEVGPLGVATLGLVLAVQAAALLACLEQGRSSAALLLAAATARLAVTWSCTPRTPAASPTGLGATVAGTVRLPVAALSTLVVLGVGLVAAAVDDDVPPHLPLLAVAVGLTVAALLRRHAVRRLGGITGDVLGAVVEVTTAAVLVAVALSP
jgi:adenosylcobinamide-GDP ribazoletransferase